ncbi:DUF2304 domain-containing protein [Colwellia sp. RSH04]|uniref:DUF2304 domain-containing protein n=1 Tax=Colwellia sp. RSH04 TaxID=2305464 RepID=UPI000E598AA7|nr:DUF2304 domain-containing protein [Colwellia sp. RSH04]RHW74898.1 DUF2304 domain-containing protein [Colwellia sp. RSH04]
MTNPQIVSSVIALTLAVIIYWLVRRDHLAPRLALRWVFVASIVLILGTFPVIIDWIGVVVGVAYPPIIAVVVGLGALLIKVLLLDIEKTKAMITQDRIIQKLAILEAELESFKSKDEESKKH